MSITPVSSFNLSEPIPGYFTKERLGSGGCGEVWKAHVPGGLTKAIKIVYGHHDPRRAARELRSLNRIKQARHPFLLSIERIEIVDDNLVIVTELADITLKQLFDQFTARGRRGIPRQDLLGYLRDAADGLDYIYSHFSLQHLDIKPENLLLIGDRIKVADFGLSKNIYDRSVSLVEGLTPTYAPPEVFDGRPHRNSDQYSLAIVYQYMLTGQLPFDGNTSAQLAAQHLHGVPSVSVLPKAEQPIIARALSKDPEARYSDCRGFIDHLLKLQLTPEEASGGSVATEERERRDDGVTCNVRGQVCAEGSADGATQQIEPHLIVARNEDTTLASPVNSPPLSSIAINSDTITYHPTIFIAVGGLATCVLQKLRRRLCDRFGTLQSIPSIGLLAVDTDARSLNAAMQMDGDTPLAENETLAVPLRSPQDYRSQADRLLEWLSRRWLYNIPKNLQTGGLRPLGRLALVDHAARTRARFTQLIADVTSEDSLHTTRSQTGMNFVADTPRIYLIASLSGATGGGMFLDLAYLLRTLLIERGLSDEEVHGILLTASTRNPQQRDLAMGNACAALDELWHFSRPGSCYPGEPACGIPPFHGNNRTFGSCYLLPVGHNLNEQEMEMAIDPIAEYLYCSSTTPGSAFFDQSRSADQTAAQPELRTFGLCQIGGSNTALPGQIAQQLCHQVVTGWRSVEAPGETKTTFTLTRPTELLAARNQVDSRYQAVERLAREQALLLGLDSNRINRQVRDMLLQEMGADPTAYFAAVIEDSLRSTTPAKGDQPAEALMNRVVQAVDILLAEPGTHFDGMYQSQFDNLYEVILTRVEVRAGELGGSLRDWLIALIDNSQVRVEGAMRAGEWFQRHLRDLEGHAAIMASQIKEAVFSARETLLAMNVADASGKSRDRRDPPALECLDNLKSRILEYAHLRLEEIVHRAVCKWLRASDAHVTHVIDQLQELSRQLNQFSGRFATGQASATAEQNGCAPEFARNHWQLLRGDVMREQSTSFAILDRIADEQLLQPLGGLRHFLSQSADMGKELLRPLLSCARMLTIRNMRSLSGHWLLGPSVDQPDINLERLRCWIDASKPALRCDNRSARFLLILPNTFSRLDIEAKLSQVTDRPITVVYAQDSDLVACCETQSLTFAQVMASLVGDNPRCAEIAQRLHTRIDVNWQSVGGQPVMGGRSYFQARK